ncbi:unnamed protein product [Cuscuta epithymum]|uniref:Uncharacterized protein n=1 Tax=Cuscuta epithymum TaxID=186058 RepID=A0AAV0D859_9ASTE|nr:unnamed protein product [Cuscuta epithymum]CAH9131039.1 unnamed protein product [Cuscuta epithymum]
MVRAPCCDKTGLKKGPWTPEEDHILVSYIQSNGHANWRALPKLAGLLRCGKSCRLRWTNYLRPDIKRGNFTKEEEDAIIHLHETLGNRWSTIAARLPGRTDNEIKNVWHTHLKKKLKDYQPNHKATSPRDKTPNPKPESSNVAEIQQNVTSPVSSPSSPRPSSSETSSLTDSVGWSETPTKREDGNSSEYFPPIDESFWTEDVTDFTPEEFDSLGSLDNCTENMDGMVYQSKTTDEDLDFWYDIFIRAGDVLELPQF